MAVKYVSSAAGGAGDGSSPAAAWTLDQALAATPAAGDEIRVMADGVYARTTTGTVAWANGTPAANILLTGANASGAVDGTRPTIRAAAGSITLLATTADHLRFRDLILDGNNQAAVSGLSLTPTYGRCSRVKAVNTTGTGILVQGGNSVWGERIEVYGCSGTAGVKVAGPARVYFAVARNNACTGLVLSATASAHHWLSFGNTGGSSCGLSLDSVGFQATEGVAYNNGSHGVSVTGNAGYGTFLANVASYGNGGAGFGTDAVQAGASLLNCAAGGNTGGNYTAGNLPNVEGFVSLSGNPFDTALVAALTASSTIEDCFAAFRAVATGGGAQLRAAGYPAYLDIGAVQHQDAGGGGGGGAPVVGSAIVRGLGRVA